MIEKKLFGTWEEKSIFAYTLSNGFLKVTVINYGAAVQSIVAGGREIALGYDSAEGYTAQRSYFGATIGRVANRISGGEYSLGGRRYKLDLNDVHNCLHGGYDGYDRRIFDGGIEGESVVFTLHSGDGDQGFGGELTMTVKYSLEDNALVIEYGAECGGDTLWAPTNHTFFNLGGECAPVYDTLLYINADRYAPVNDKLVPTGELREVEGTPFDFTAPKEIGRDIFSGDGQLETVGGGYDHNFALRGEHAATASCGGLTMSVYTDMPGVQLYSGNFLDGSESRGGSYKKHYAFCLEPQYFPNAANCEAFESPVLYAGERKRHYIKYVFNTEK